MRPSVLQVAAAVCLLLGFPFLGAYGQQSPATAAGRFFFFHGTSNTSGNVALGTGKIGPSSVHGFGAVSSHGSANAAAFNLTGFVFCSGGPPPGAPCLGLSGTVIATFGSSINGAKVGDPVVVILVENTDHSGSTCIILPAPGLAGTCDNFFGTIVIPRAFS